MHINHNFCVLQKDHSQDDPSAIHFSCKLVPYLLNLWELHHREERNVFLLMVPTLPL